MNLAYRTLISFLSFNIGWWVCAVGASYGYPWAGPALTPLLLGLHLYLSPTPRGEALFIASCGGAGFLFDTLLLRAGLFTTIPDAQWAPAWIVAMWMLLGLTYESMLMVRKTPRLLFLMGAISGPMSYFAGEALNILSYTRPLWLSLPVHGLIWGALTIMLFIFRDWSLRVTVRRN
ncbi:MAG: DUF2878 domain-containing protein [Calothrix sp. SM1_5_4]|nr:DUF2878 domain-containing protein [Calothrix sp. SM1_5_4]